MSGLTVNLIILGLCLVAGGWGLSRLFVDDLDGIGFFAFMSGAIAGLVALMLLGIGTIGPRIDERTCSNRQEIIERPTRFARLTYFSWDCYVQTDDGWIPLDQWRSDDEADR